MQHKTKITVKKNTNTSQFEVTIEYKGYTVGYSSDGVRSIAERDAIKQAKQLVPLLIF